MAFSGVGTEIGWPRRRSLNVIRLDDARRSASSSVSAAIAQAATACLGDTSRSESMNVPRYVSAIDAPLGLMKSANA
jgi:hypothetical protein